MSYVNAKRVEFLKQLDLIYRTICAVLYNFAQSGHPGGSISSGPIAIPLMLEYLDQIFSDPKNRQNDRLIYAAGHKSLGLYALLAMFDELVLAGQPELLPKESRLRLRLEDLLGYRRNPCQRTPLIEKFEVKFLDGHPTPATPPVIIATGASGVGVPTAFGAALGALDLYGENAPLFHVLEGEAGMTAGRVHEALAAAVSGNWWNIVLHVDFNQASIDSNHVCREGDKPGDYVQWDPTSLLETHGWRVIEVADGINFAEILEAQQQAKEIASQHAGPIAVVYHTVKGYGYGYKPESPRSSHGAGHPFCSTGYYAALAEFETYFGTTFPRHDETLPPPEEKEQLYWDTLLIIRREVQQQQLLTGYVGHKVLVSAQRLSGLDRQLRPKAPNLKKLDDWLYHSDPQPNNIPPELILKPGSKTTLRAELGRTLGWLNNLTNGALIGGAADLLGSTSVELLNADFPTGFFNASRNPESRLIAAGGICEDALNAMAAGLSAFGGHIGVSSSYAAFNMPMGFTAARLHCIGENARQRAYGEQKCPYIMIGAHASVKTGEDGPTHADPQALQILQGSFPAGINSTLITLTPWSPDEIYPLLMAALLHKPAVIAPFVTRPAETVLNRADYGLPPAAAAIKGVYLFHRFRQAKFGQKSDGTIILQGSAVTYEFVCHVLPELRHAGYELNVYYIASNELFDRQTKQAQLDILPEKDRREAMAITDFTLPTMYRWVTSEFGRRSSLHPFKNGDFPGSGEPKIVLKELGLDGPAQWKAIQEYVWKIRNFQ